MADFSFGFTEGSFLLLNGHKHLRLAEEDLITARALKEEQPLRLLLNLLFYHFNHSEPTYKSQRIKLQDVIATCNQLNGNALT